MQLTPWMTRLDCTKGSLLHRFRSCPPRSPQHSCPPWASVATDRQTTSSHRRRLESPGDSRQGSRGTRSKLRCCRPCPDNRCHSERRRRRRCATHQHRRKPYRCYFRHATPVTVQRRVASVRLAGAPSASPDWSPQSAYERTASRWCRLDHIERVLVELDQHRRHEYRRCLCRRPSWTTMTSFAVKHKTIASFSRKHSILQFSYCETNGQLFIGLLSFSHIQRANTHQNMVTRNIAAKEVSKSSTGPKENTNIDTYTVYKVESAICFWVEQTVFILVTLYSHTAPYKYDDVLGCIIFDIFCIGKICTIVFKIIDMFNLRCAMYLNFT